jgi:WD40 repeat protein
MSQRQEDNNSVNTGDIRDVSGEVNIVGGDIYKGYTAEQVSVLLTQITSTFQPKPFDGRCPYKGLDFFEEEDSELFFGREKVVEDLVGRVKDSRTVFITGPSGSGKSSLVRAGLIPALKRGAITDLHSEHWLYGIMEPGRDPMSELARVISGLAESTNAGDEICTKGLTDVTIFARWCEIALKEGRYRRALIFIDQFEEIFTQIKSEEQRTAFLDLLTYAANVEKGRIIILFSIRSDFISNCATYPPLNMLLSQQFIQIGAMQPHELVSAIAQPALRVGLRIDPYLVAQVINDMEGEPGSLPLMQFAMKDLFDGEQARGGVIALTLDEYLQRGGIHKSLERHADSAFAKLSENEQEIARTVFNGLIEVGHGTQDTRRTASLDEFIYANTGAEYVKAVIQKLADARLVITNEQAGKDTVTISHEKLIDAWPWLKKLVNENRDAIALKNRIALDADEWDSQKRDASYLYHGTRFVSIQEQLKTQKIILSGMTKDFIDECIRVNGKERSRAARQQRVVWTSVGVAITVLFLAIASLIQRNQAVKEVQIALAFQLVAQAQSLEIIRSSKEMIAVLLATRSMEILPSSEAAQVLLGNLTGHAVYSLNQSQEGDVIAIAYSPDGKYLASAGGKVIHILEAATGKEVSTVQQDDTVYAVTFSPDSRLLSSGGRDQTVRIWDPLTGDELHRLQQDGEVRDVVFSPDGKTLAGSGFKAIRIWETGTGTEVGKLVLKNTGPVWDLAYSPDGKWIASADAKTARVWDAAKGEEIFRKESREELKTVAFSPDSQYLVSNCDDMSACVWEVASGEEKARMAHAGTVMSAAFSHNGKLVATGSSDNTARVWEALTGREISQMTHDVSVISVSFSPKDFYVVSTSSDFTARVWDSGTGEELARKTHDSEVDIALFSPDGKYVASGGDDRMLRVWTALPTAEMSRMIFPGKVYSVAFSPDGKYALAGASDGTARVWEAATDQEVGRMEHDGTVFSAAFSPDGRYVVSGGGTEFSVWDFLTGKELFRAKHGKEVTSLAFSPDGKYVVSASDDPNIRVWGVETGREVAHFDHKGLAAMARFSADGKYVVSAGGKQACVWTALEGDTIACFEHESDVYDAALSPDNRFVISGDGTTAHVWEVQTGKQLSSVEHGADVYRVGFSPDGKYAVSGGNRLTVVWDPLTGEKIFQIKHDGIVQRVAFSPDGKYIISGDDKTSRIVEVATGQKIALLNHNNLVKAVAISPDDRYALSGGFDKTARVWLWHPDDLIQQTCANMFRNLTQEEWNTYLPNRPYQAICPELSIEPK